ncbi:polysaccharide biosynthesis/export family protein [uncultured Roseobacter sp.]|uniref:polysaccharide biosynthesis/export family protein n=1 Tax=uncultured Roseobacter sp. TaxID=114847 RepID=UPI0026157DC4|nr:polysaccharide biosynthesis/export family protein [uncultured Roseobacter sp.]
MLKILKTIMAGLVLSCWAVMALAQGSYRVQTGDTLTIEVLEDGSLNRTVAVLPDGRFNFPFAGALPARGLTVSEIEASISSAISPNFATSPTVFVSVNPAVRAPLSAGGAAASGPTISVYFVGEVNRPGVVEVETGTTLLQAVAISGGVSRFAAVKRIQLRRTDPRTRQQSVTTLNYKALADGAVTTDIELKDGDVILVPERRLFE